jgi:hypothetical protein
VSQLYTAVNGGLDVTNIIAGGLTGSAIAANSINVPLLKNSSTSFGVQQAAAKHFGGGYFSMTSGSYSFYPGLSTDAAAGTIASIGGNVTVDTATDFDVANKGGIARVQANQTAQAIVWLAVLNATNTATNQAFLTAFYLQASPPYDLGDGEVPVFVFVLVDKTGQPRMTFVGFDPPWAASPRKILNAPSVVQALDDPNTLGAALDAIDQHAENWAGVKQLKKQLDSTQVKEDRVSLNNDIETITKMIWSQVPETPDEKNRHMSTTPHPFINNDIDGGDVYADTAPLTPVLLDPMSKTAQHLALLHESGENVNALLHNGYIQLGNSHISGRSGPPQVMVVEHKFKNSKG